MHKITVSTLAFDEFICFVSTEFVKRSNFHVFVVVQNAYISDQNRSRTFEEQEKQGEAEQNTGK